ncbi:hypothetical protein B0J18DRAFT_107774 [Chaetomium sp. MPI-SDFR-AT-0129]|nr:hypothetical protein B0J18DRAFT_107774 [Chaetomium sp. MPI-SDFR-AT-0129]
MVITLKPTTHRPDINQTCLYSPISKSNSFRMTTAWDLPKPTTTEPLIIEFLPRTYESDSASGNKRWIKLILRSAHSKWHIKFTFSGSTIWDGTRLPIVKGMKRRNDLRDLCHCIDFRRIPLLDDTVTEVIVSLNASPESIKLPYTTQPSADSEYASVISDL